MNWIKLPITNAEILAAFALEQTSIQDIYLNDFVNKFFEENPEFEPVEEKLDKDYFDLDDNGYYNFHQELKAYEDYFYRDIAGVIAQVTVYDPGILMSAVKKYLNRED